MKLRFILSIIVALALTSPCLAEVEILIKGRVVNTDGKPVEGIKVFATTIPDMTAQPRTPLIGTVTTSTDGSFIFRPLRVSANNGLYFVAYEQGRWLGWKHASTTTRGKGNEAVSAKAITDVKIVVSKLGTVEGRVIDEHGMPIAGATIRHAEFCEKATDKSLYFPSFADGAGTAISVIESAIKLPPTVSGLDGKYRLAEVPNNMELRVVVTKPGLAMKPHVVGYRFSNYRAVVMVPSGRLSGRLGDENGEGVPRKTITIYGQNPWYRVTKVLTAIDGSFSLDGITPGRYRITLNDDLRLSATTTMRNVLVAGNQTTDLGNIIITPPVAVSGKVVDADTGKPLRQARIRWDAEGWNVSSTTTDTDGRYTLQALPGEVTLSYSIDDPFYSVMLPYPQKVTVSVPKTGLQGVDFKLKRADIGRVRVVDLSGRPVSGAKVSLLGFGLPKGMTTDKDGNFEVPLPSARKGNNSDAISLTAEDTKSGYGIVQSMNRSELASRTAVMTLRPARSCKVIVHDFQGRALEGASVHAYSTNKYVRTNRKGEAVFRKIFEGASSGFSIWMNGYYSYSSDYSYSTVGGPDWKAVQEIALKPLKYAEGKVMDEQGNPVSGARVTLSLLCNARATSGSDGSFRIAVPDLEKSYASSAEFGMAVFSEDEAMGALRFLGCNELLNDSITVILKPARTLRVVVRDTNGRPLTGVVIQANVRCGNANVLGMLVSNGTYTATTDADGEGILHGMYSGGKCDLRVSLPGYYYEPFSPKPIFVGGPEWRDTVEVVMEPANREQPGTVVDMYGLPVKGVPVRAWSSEGMLTAITDAEGKFVLKGLPGSRVSVSAENDRLIGTAVVSKDTPTIEIKVHDRSTGR